MREENRTVAGVLRGPLLWSAVFASAVLAVLSIIGAFLGDERAGRFFNSTPVAAFWLFWIAILSAGIIFSRTVRRRLGGLAMHLGAILILIGAMVGSDAGHRLSARFFGVSKVPKGYLVIREGETSHDILDRKTQGVIDRLPFDIRLVEFRIEHYRSDSSWSLCAMRRDEHGHRQNQAVDWAKGQPFEIAETDLKVEVVEYLKNSRPVIPKDAATALEIAPDNGPPLRVVPEAGGEVRLKTPPLTIKILRVFGTLTVRPSGEVVDVPGPPLDRAIEFEIRCADGTTRKAYVFESGLIVPPDPAPGVQFHYAGGTPAYAVADPESAMPAMRLRVADRRGQTAEAWLIPSREEGYALLRVRSLPGFGSAPEIIFLLLPPDAPVKAYQSEVEVLKDDRVIRREVIEVNHPLHYGGYQFYQHSYGEDGGVYTVLSISSDSGLDVVWTGFVLLGGGAFWQLWVRPAVRALRRQSANGN